MTLVLVLYLASNCSDIYASTISDQIVPGCYNFQRVVTISIKEKSRLNYIRLKSSSIVRDQLICPTCVGLSVINLLENSLSMGLSLKK